MTYNLDEGTDYNEVLDAILSGNPASVPPAVQLTVDNVRATNPLARIRDCSDTVTPEFDLLKLLGDGLDAERHHYTVLTAIKEFDVSGVTPSLSCVRATNYDAILARTDRADGQLRFFNVQQSHYMNFVAFQTVSGPINNFRGWGSVDVLLRDRVFRFITTHLESVNPAIQHKQAAELLQGPANSTIPVILAADFNATANNPSDPSFATYCAIVNGGFVDEWPVANPLDPGLTCCQAPSLTNTTSLLSDRIDLVFAGNAFAVREAHLVGTAAENLSDGIFWPSDHTGVFAKLKPSD